MKKIILLILLFSFGSQAQKIVDDLKEVKKPKEGKLYFDLKGSKLHIFVNEKFNLVGDYKIEKPEPPKPDPPILVENNVLLGYWMDSDKLLTAKKFKDGYYLIQHSADSSYIIGRGRNLLSDYKTIINSNFDLSKIKSQESELGGLFVPDNFPNKEMEEQGYKKNSNGEWTKSNIDPPTPPKPPTTGLNGIPNYPHTNGLNTTDWSGFENLKLPKGLFNVGGFGFPLYGNETLSANGKINLFEKGWSNVFNLSELPRSRWDGKNEYTFNQLFYYLRTAAVNMVRAGQTGAEYGDIQRIANTDWGDTNLDYSGITIKGAIELGRHIHYISGSSNSPDNPNYDIDLSDGVIMIDEESMALYNWQGGDSYSFYGYLTQGVWEASGKKKKVFWYAQPVQRWIHSNIFFIRQLTDAQLVGLYTDSNIRMNSNGWKASEWFVDHNGSYAKVPYLNNTDIYEKDANGNFKLENGKRKYRKEDFILNIYGQDTKIYKEPHDWIKWNGTRANGTDFYGWQSEFGTYNPSAAVSLPQGWKWGNTAKPNPSSWRPETELFVEGVYLRASGIIGDLLMLNKLEKGKWELGKATEKYKLYGEHRPRTENWTNGGNSIDVREVGDSEIFLMESLLWYSGGSASSTWDDGYAVSNPPNKGNPLFRENYGNGLPINDNWNRYHAKLAAVQSILKPLEGTEQKDWVYVNFFMPYVGWKHNEVISSGIYYNGKLYAFFLNPTLENGESQTLEFKAGSTTETLKLVGHEVYFKTFDVPHGLNPVDFKLSYTTIYNRNVKVNGRVTNKLEDHYE